MGAVCNYASEIKWTEIQTHILQLRALKDKLELEKQQKDLENKHIKSDATDYIVLENIKQEKQIKLGYAENIEGDNLTDEERRVEIEQYLKVLHYKFELQKSEKTNLHLPNNYNHNQIKADLDVDLSWLNELFDKDNDKDNIFKHLDNYADYFNSINKEANRSIDNNNGNK